jgi:hypothetical protein
MNGLVHWLQNRFGWWWDEHRQLNLQWLVLPGDPTARRPEEYFILWRWWWRFAWKWYILEVGDTELDYQLVFLTDSAQRISKARVEKSLIAVRIGPQNTRFGLVNGQRESAPLTVVAGPFTWRQIQTVTDREPATRKWEKFYDAQLF